MSDRTVDSVWIKLDPFCRALVDQVQCPSASVMMVETFEHGWLSLCDIHGFYFAGQEFPNIIVRVE